MTNEIPPDYSTYSYHELEGCLERINEERYPERTLLIKNLLNDMDNMDKLKQRDKAYKSKSEKYVHIALETAFFVVMLVLGYFFYYS